MKNMGPLLEEPAGTGRETRARASTRHTLRFTEPLTGRSTGYRTSRTILTYDVAGPRPDTRRVETRLKGPAAGLRRGPGKGGGSFVRPR